MGETEFQVRAMAPGPNPSIRIDPDVDDGAKTATGVVPIFTGEIATHLAQWIDLQCQGSLTLTVERLCDFMLEHLEATNLLNVIHSPGTGIATSFMPAGTEGMLVFTNHGFARIWRETLVQRGQFFISL